MFQFRPEWIVPIRQSLRRFFAGRGANSDITSLTGITGPISAASRLVMSEQATLDTPPTNTIALGAVDVDGISSLIFKSPTGFESRIMRDRTFAARNNTGTTISKGTVVVATGVLGSGSSAAVIVSRAQANTTAMMPAIGIAAQDIPTGTTGRCFSAGKIEGLNTSAFAALDILFVSPTVAGGLTNVRPSTPNRAQPVAQVLNSSTNNGAILVNAQAVLNEALSTIQNSFTIGDSTAGVKSLKFAGTTVRSLFDGATVPTGQLVGDTWTERNATTQAIVGQWEWNGTYWLSRDFYTAPFGIVNTIAGANNLQVSLPRIGASNIFLTGFAANGTTSGTHDASNYWTFDLRRLTKANGATSIATLSANSIGINSAFQIETALNLHLDLAALNFGKFLVLVGAVGTPSSLVSPAGSITFRLARI